MDPLHYFCIIATEMSKAIIYRIWWVLVSFLWAYWLSRWVSLPIMLVLYVPLAVHLAYWLEKSDQSVSMRPETSHSYLVWWTLYTTVVWWMAIPYLTFCEASNYMSRELAYCFPFTLYCTLFTLMLRGVQHHAAHKVKEWWPNGAPAIVRLHAAAHGEHHRSPSEWSYWVVPFPAFSYFLTWEIVTSAWAILPTAALANTWAFAWFVASVMGHLNGAIMFELGHCGAHMGYWSLEQGFNTLWHNTHHRVGGFYAIFPAVDWPNLFFERHVKGFIDFQANWMPEWWKRWCEPTKTETNPM